MSNPNILVVDDTPENLRLLVDLLAREAFKVRPVPSGKLALAAAQALPPDLILLDITMPEMDGYQVCQALKADPRTAGIPVIFLSALNDVFDKVRGFQVGGVDYIAKPFQIEEVLARIRIHLQIRSLQERLQQRNAELTQALDQLKVAQNQLVFSEKMAALGQLVASVAHELNTPLGAIRSSIENISDFLGQQLGQLPRCFEGLDPDRQQAFLALLGRATDPTAPPLSSREKRQRKRATLQQLQERGIPEAEIVADTLVDMGIHGDLDDALALLAHSRPSLELCYRLSSLWRSAQTIDLASGRAASVVYALKSYARSGSGGERIRADLRDGIETALTLYNNQIKHGVEVIRHYEDLPPIACYPDDLSQVWMNLIHNGLQAMNHQGTLTISLARQGDEVRIQIGDSGPGIPPEIQARIFEPFFTTKPRGEGTGLGLSIVSQILEKHQGRIQCDSQPGQTTFSVFLPIQ